MSEKLINLQKKINIKFKNISTLKKSITHKSYNPNNNNEKLEFLGDRILGLVISKKLLELYPEERERVDHVSNLPDTIYTTILHWTKLTDPIGYETFFLINS